MELLSTVWHLFGAIFVWLVGLVVSIKISRIFDISWRRAAILYVWHTIFCVVYANYVISAGGDAIEYYESSLLSDINVSVGTAAVVLFTRIFSYYLGFSFLGTFLVFNIVGVVGLIAVDGSLKLIKRDKSKFIRFLMSAVVFLPSMSFWSASIGKDAFSFASAALLLWSALDLRNRVWLLVCSIFLMLLVRPHIAVLMLVGLFGSLLFQKNVSSAKKLILMLCCLFAGVALLPFALEYSGLGGGVGVEELESYVQERQGYNQDGGGGIDISSMSLPMQLFTYLFRPLPFEANNFFSFAASLDNLILLYVFAFGIFGFFKRLKLEKTSIEQNKSLLWIYALSAWLILSMTTANLGISIRQKWMFAPILIFLFVSMIANSKNRNTEP